ncbi:hypothetical protein BU15DRAFT_53526 [Melanogaster broomeanus]|nr:hypothetical protein BU15DRAFT_53526 [Melanogaster broomeanus]
MPESLLTKRLHISGLTPSITPGDLERRLSSFGTVKAMDGFGARDALGDPRKFAYVTMEIGAKELAKCLNVLSGSTWKGTKLRIGDAKPDFRERIAHINSLPPRPVRSTRTRARNHGYPSPSLPLTPLSVTAATSTPGWVTTPSGRIVRPMRMRPERPLGLTLNALSASKGKDAKGTAGKVKKRVKPAPVRARRRKIDPTKWDSVYLKGVFLESVSVSPTTGDVPKVSGGEEDEVLTNADDTEEEEEEEENTSDQGHSTKAPVPTSHEAVDTNDIRHESTAALALLGDMFGDEGDWGGSESVDGMEGLDDGEAREKGTRADEEGDFEERPTADAVRASGKNRLDEEVGKRTRDGDIEMAEPDPVTSTDTSTSRPAQSTLQTNLKALFAPREEEASFSLLGHLDLDIELGDDILGIGIPTPGTSSQEAAHPYQPTLAAPEAVHVSTTTSTSRFHSGVTLDPSLPLLFPLPESLPYPYPSSSEPSSLSKNRKHVVPNTFARLPEDTSDSIREQWEKDKTELTHEWKKAWREARGGKRGRGGGGATDE